jgi:S-adenosylmethionine decarboxylase
MIISEKRTPPFLEENVQEQKAYFFAGRHLIASYFECDLEALANHRALMDCMVEAVKATGATLLHSVQHEFYPQGYAMIMLLSESHASIHTYPEHRSCFVDIFTCGACLIEKFDDVLQEYLHPQGLSKKIFCRTNTIEEESLLYHA